jgi:hypothetical protein
MGLDHEALESCDEAVALCQSGGFSAPEGTFAEMASAFLRRSLAAATRH